MNTQRKDRKTLLKKVVSILIGLCMIVSATLPLTVVTALAEAPTSYTTITTDSTALVNITSQGTSKFFKFVPTQNGKYKFYSSSTSLDTYGALLDANGTQLASNDDGGGNHNFSITYQCTANTTYYVKAYLYSSSTIGSYTLNVETVELYCTHNYVLQSVTAADCENDGLELYACSLCGDSYSNVVTYALGHNYVNSICTRCGDVDYTTLTVVDVNTASKSYPLFNSGCTGNGSRYSSSSNYDEDSFTNGNHDLYSSYSNSNIRNIRLGLGFTMAANATEMAQVTIYAYDVDEGSGERDSIRLIDETADTSTELISTSNTDYLSGQDSRWSTTTFNIPAELLVEGHTYHFENEETVSGWVVYIRTVDIQINGLDSDPNPSTTDGIIASTVNFSGSISSEGTVSTVFSAIAYEQAEFNLEYKATYLAEGDQKGGATSQVTISTRQTTYSKSFSLESNSPRGTYEVSIYVRRNGILKLTKSFTASYGYSAVSYNENGGSNNKPVDNNAYSQGDTVTVKFDYVPSKYGYTFLGWSTDRYATEPMYTSNGNRTFTIGSRDVTLYAIWEIDVCSHEWIQTSRTEAGCTTYGEIVYTCNYCGETTSELLEPTQHNYQIINTVEPTCTANGYIDFVCQNAGCGATKRQILERIGHSYGNDNVCDRCGNTINNHQHSYTVTVVNPTCTSMGYTEYTCNCGHSYRAFFIESTHHNWNSGVVTIAATCTSDGLMTYTCQNCLATKTAVIVAEHQWNEVITAEKTCTRNGSKTKICTACGTIVNEIIPAGHNWNTGVETLAPTCKTEGAKTCTCLDCGETQIFEIPKLGHTYVDGVCTNCGIKYIDDITESSHPIYGMYFEVDDVISDYGSSLIDEYGLMLDYNSDANLEKVGVYLTQDGTMWRRCIAVKGTNIEYATFVPYLSYGSDIKYSGLNHEWINIFRLSETSNGVWCYNDYATIGANLEDAYGNLLLSLYDIGQAGAETRIFDNLDDMIIWLNDACDNHKASNWIEDVPATCVAGSRYKRCTICHTELEREDIPPVAQHVFDGWIVDRMPTATQPGIRHQECVTCHTISKTEAMPILAKLVIDNIEAEANKTVKVTIDIQNNPGIMGAVLTLDYDPALTLIDAKAGSAWRNLNFSAPSNFANSCNFIWDGLKEADFSNGSIIVLTFKVPANGYVGRVYDINVSYTQGNLIDSDLQAVDLEIENGSITVVDSFGDANDDGIVDVADIIVLRRYLLGGYDVAIDRVASDLNNDGDITIADVILLRRLLVG